MNKAFLLLFLISFSILALGQTDSVYLEGMIFNSKANEFKLYPIQTDQTSIDPNQIITINPDSNGNFKVAFPLLVKDYYIFQVENQNFFLILDSAKTIKIYADGTNLNKFLNIVGSEDSKTMLDFILVTENWKVKIDSANNAIKLNPNKSQEINEYMQKEYLTFQSTLSNFIYSNINSPALIAAINVINVENDFQTFEKIILSLKKSFGNSKLVKQYYANYQFLLKQKEEQKLLGIGKIAPTFEEELLNPIKGNKTLKLDELKGKIVLLDFWASWCGPCRRENPNVVKIYEKYKSKGFSIVSISLDTDKNKWKAAIQKDNLSWPYHVSDLGGWKSKVAKIYQVSSIPFTVLIDTEGKIIQTNLRGQTLEKELEKIYGF